MRFLVAECTLMVLDSHQKTHLTQHTAALNHYFQKKQLSVHPNYAKKHPMILLSVAIVCFNEEQNLPKTLAPLQGLADEIIVVDSFSTDSTPAIAEAAGAKVFQEKWAGYVAQKNSALAKCNGKWILALDADEELTPEAVDSIKSIIKAEDSLAGYFINRRTFYMGKLLRYAWQPDKKLRLVRRTAEPYWGGYDPHDSLRIKSGNTSQLQGELTHYSYNGYASHMRKTAAHAQKAAESYFIAGKRSGLFLLIFKPGFVFFNRLFLRRAILDGVPGVMAAFSAAMYVHMKYAFLWELELNNKAKN